MEERARSSLKVPRFMKVGFKELKEAAMQISKQIINEEGRPACIVCIGRGSMVFARLMSDYIGVNKTLCINSSFYSNIGTRMDKVAIGEIPKELFDMEGYLLLVDDVADSGQTMKRVIEKISSSAGNKIVSCTSAYKSGSEFKPDFYWITADKSTWIIFEYEVNEAMESFVKSGDSEGIEFVKDCLPEI